MLATKDKCGLFITGTGTGVGKTIITAALSRLLNDRGIDVGVMKPLETGVPATADGGEDACLLKQVSGSQDSLSEISPLHFETPSSPATASRLEGRAVNYTGLVEQVRGVMDRHQFTLVEGAGGLMVPVSGGFLISDLARDLGLPLLVVADAQLGTINHSLLTLLAARYFELETAGYIINRMPEVPSAAEKSAPHDLASLTFEELLAVVPEVPGTPEEQALKVAGILPELPSWPLLKKILPLDD